MAATTNNANLQAVPASIDRSDLYAALRSLGIDYEGRDVLEVNLRPMHFEVVLLREGAVYSDYAGDKLPTETIVVPIV